MKGFGKHPGFIVHSEEPFNAEPPLERIGRSFLTPCDAFFVRAHGNVPRVDEASYRLRIHGLVEIELELSLEDIRRFPVKSVVASLYCAGTRRDELMEVADIPGETPWSAGATGNARWTGTPLRGVLRAAGVGSTAAHAAFTGLDEVRMEGGSCDFGASIPLEKAISPETLLAYEMNGEPLRPEHGFPLRVVAPGYIGARSVKWLSDVELRETPSENPFQAIEYRLSPPDSEGGERSFALGGLPVNSVICEPRDGETLPVGEISVRGYALAGACRISRVDVSADGGETWASADLSEEDSPWSWRLWEASVELGAGPHRIVVRAMDSSANSQPEKPVAVWNPKGYLNNSWHEIKVNGKPRRN